MYTILKQESPVELSLLEMHKLVLEFILLSQRDSDPSIFSAHVYFLGEILGDTATMNQVKV